MAPNSWAYEHFYAYFLPGGVVENGVSCEHIYRCRGTVPRRTNIHIQCGHTCNLESKFILQQIEEEIQRTFKSKQDDHTQKYTEHLMSNTGGKIRRVLKGAVKFLQSIRTIIYSG